MKNKPSLPSLNTFDPAKPLPELKDLVSRRDGNLVTAQWRGSPKFSVGVLSAIDDEQAFERAAVSMSLAVKPGFKEAEMKACAKEMRTRAEAKRAAGLPPVMTSTRESAYPVCEELRGTPGVVGASRPSTAPSPKRCLSAET